MIQQNKPLTYAAFCDDDEIRMSSSSGGVFSIIAEHILEINGTVYGVTMTEDCKGAKFLRISSKNELCRLRGSKYLQAKLGSCYNSVKKDLEQGLMVLFSGTGCQINGLKSFLQKEYNNLFCVDVICHGTPSPGVWRRYVDEKQMEMNGKIVGIQFRCKDKNWLEYGLKFINNNDKNAFIPMKEDPYMKLFLRDYSLRPSCFECTAKKRKTSDITIADFWGIDCVAPEMDDGKGVSLVLVRTDKGNELFQNISLHLNVKRVSYEEGVRCNQSEYMSANRPADRNEFFRELIDNNRGETTIDNLAKKYCRISKVIVLKAYIKKGIKKLLNILPWGNKILGILIK